MTAALVGNVSIGQVVPTTASLIAAAVADLTARLAGIAQISATISITPPTLALTLVALAEATLAIEAQIAVTAALGLPEVSIDLTAMLAIAADLNAQLALLIGLSLTLGTAGIFAFTHNGDATTYGAEMQAQVSAVAPAGNNVHSVTFLATDPAVFEALGKLLLTG